jgi:hypothetical protein
VARIGKQQIKYAAKLFVGCVFGETGDILINLV